MFPPLKKMNQNHLAPRSVSLLIQELMFDLNSLQDGRLTEGIHNKETLNSLSNGKGLRACYHNNKEPLK